MTGAIRRKDKLISHLRKNPKVRCQSNVFAAVPDMPQDQEFSEALVRGRGVRVERIISRGHTSPPQGGWYDQTEDEWVMVVRGAGTLEFADGRQLTLRTGDHVYIPAHDRHRVVWTEPEEDTVWLAVFYGGE